MRKIPKKDALDILEVFIVVALVAIGIYVLPWMLLVVLALVIIDICTADEDEEDKGNDETRRK